MPTAAHKPCSYPGCTTLVKSGRCPQHQQPDAWHQRNAERQRLYDRAWRKRRQIWLADHPWCESCLANGLYVPATDVHHVIRHEGDTHIFRTSPLKSLCHACHSAVTLAEVQTGRGADNVLNWGVNSGRGGPYEKKSQHEESL